MKKIVLLGCLVFLSACSEEIDQKENTVLQSVEVDGTSNTNEFNSDLDEKQDNQELSNKDASKNINQDNKDESSQVNLSDEQVISSKENKEVNDIKEEDLYNYYTDLETNEEITFTSIDEHTLELPLYEENKKVFKEDPLKVMLKDFQNGEIEYFEEPISNGYLVVVNLNLLNEEKYGKSYSLLYNDIEYAFFITEEDPNSALAVVENVDLEAVKKAQLLIMK